MPIYTYPVFTMRLHALLLAAWAFWALSAAALRAPGEDFDLLPGEKNRTIHRDAGRLAAQAKW